MHIRILLVLVALGLSHVTVAEFRTITEAYEVDLSNLTLPATVNGKLTFRQCSECDAQTLRVTGKTRYLINDREFTLAEFKRQLRRVRHRKDQNISVSHHLESNTIRAIKVWL